MARKNTQEAADATDATGAPAEGATDPFTAPLPASLVDPGPSAPEPAPAPGPVAQPAAAPVLVRVRLPAEAPQVAVGPYARGQFYDVDPAMAARLFEHGFLKAED